ncbi:MAG TPA: hypothetical protein VF701_10610 [Thermoanaerobaculia bacterium]
MLDAMRNCAGVYATVWCTIQRHSIERSRKVRSPVVEESSEPVMVVALAQVVAWRNER